MRFEIGAVRRGDREWFRTVCGWGGWAWEGGMVEDVWGIGGAIAIGVTVADNRVYG